MLACNLQLYLTNFMHIGSTGITVPGIIGGGTFLRLYCWQVTTIIIGRLDQHSISQIFMIIDTWLWADIITPHTMFKGFL